MNRIVMPLPLFQRSLRQLMDRTPGEALLLPVGISRTGEGVELLVTSGETGSRLAMTLTAEMAAPVALPPDGVGALLLGNNSRRGQARGFYQAGRGRREAAQRLLLVGAGQHEIPLQTPEQGSLLRFAPAEELLAGAEARERWSRTIGALGEQTWERLRQLRYGIIGVGRSGSQMAAGLARSGARRLTLIDADRIESGNLGEMEGVTAADVGAWKAAAVANGLHARGLPRPEVAPQSITRRAALNAARDCDILICCVDHDGARLAASALATLYHIPLIDVATGVGDREGRGMGADVRLLLPGRCLLCYGGLRDDEAARHLLTGSDVEDALYAARDWRTERQGSLASLNQLAVAAALRCIEDLLAERVGESFWMRLEYRAGRLETTYPAPAAPRNGCPLCRLSGHGDAGLSAWRKLLETGFVPHRAQAVKIGKLIDPTGELTPLQVD